jgi:hypothetical protein
MAFVDWTRAQVQAPKPSSSPTPRGEKPAALPALRAGEVSVH